MSNKEQKHKSEIASDKATSGAPRRLGIALSGGGVRGFAHAGALYAIEQAGLKPDVIAGVSAGSVIAVLYAAGYKPLQIVEMFARTGFRDFAEFSMGKGGLFRIDRFGQFIEKFIGEGRRLEDLNIPTYLGVTDIDNGEPHIFSTGHAAPRVLASCSIPIVFKPVEIDGVHYVDGGVLRNHPAWIIREQCDLLIGVNVSPLKPRHQYDSLAKVAFRTYNLMAKANQSVDMDMCDVSVVTPEIASVAVFDLKKIKEIFMSGYIHTRQALQEAGLWPDKSSKIE